MSVMKISHYWSNTCILFGTIHYVGHVSYSTSAFVMAQVLCSVMDINAALKEVQRVLKPGGSFLFIEHVSAPIGSVQLLEQKLLNPLQQLVADGCHLDRSTLTLIEKAGFSSVQARSFEVDGLGILSPHIAGIAIV